MVERQRWLPCAASHDSKQLIYWVAQRIGTSEQFTCAVDSGQSLSKTMLDHLRLPPNHFSAAATPQSFEHRWRGFLDDTDSLVVYHPSTIDLLRRVTPLAHPCHVLKAVNFTSHRGNLENILASDASVANEPTAPGRHPRFFFPLPRPLDLIFALGTLTSL